MANEITLTASLSGYKAAIMGSAVAKSVTNFLATMTGNIIAEGSVSIATSDTAIPMGQVTQPNWCAFHNCDSTNFIKLKTASGGAYFARLYAGAWAFFPLEITLTAPYALADTAACVLEYLIFTL